MIVCSSTQKQHYCCRLLCALVFRTEEMHSAWKVYIFPSRAGIEYVEWCTEFYGGKAIDKVLLRVHAGAVPKLSYVYVYCVHTAVVTSEA